MISVLERLDGQIALVTGANRGIGARITLNLSELGATVYAGVRDVDSIAMVAAESDGRIIPLRLDVTDDDHIAAGAATIGERLDILVNNAGIGDWHGQTLETVDRNRLDAVWRTNLRGPTLLTQAMLPALLRHGGRVVNMSSGMGQMSEMNGTAPAYRISKTGVNGLTAYLNGEYGDRGLIANSVCPGWVRTDMGGPGANRSIEEGADTPTWLARFAPGAPGGRFWRDRKVIPW